MHKIDLTNQIFGRLTVVRRDYGKRWLCQCVCGNSKIVPSDKLRSGHTQSCGCYQKDSTIKRSTKHGFASRKKRIPEYTVWQNMKRRCLDPNTKGYTNYGGRGIAVCGRWLSDFAAFLADMGPRPTPKHTLERKDNERGYSPDNCVWATRKEQHHNRRVPRNAAIVNGMPLKRYAKMVGVPYETAYWRYKRGRPIA